MKKEKPIGVFDSGIGGLSVLKQFMRFIPYEKYVYLGDTARVPYGNKTPETVIEYSLQSASFLISKGAKLIVIACNTASSVALDEVRKHVDVPVIGMINPGAAAALRTTRNGNIGVIGTRATISSKSYDKEIRLIADSKEINIFSKACPLFVPIVEEGWLRHEATRLIADDYLSDLKSKSIDTLILGCTHYPLLTQLITELLPGVSLIDSGEHAAVSAIRVLGEAGLLAQEREEYSFKRQVEFYVTDVPSTFFDIAKSFLGFEVNSPERVNL